MSSLLQAKMKQKNYTNKNILKLTLVTTKLFRKTADKIIKLK